ncbi:long-chain fatty acid transport protein 4-like isoform X2 [Arctopsyche grandis]|uniref:long-chain fatty acid transport protein 4-like isoform X2 n=1 Tax=Arctopsyche grandis TaxID=121162 RepID=UPI00406D87FF
MFLYGRRPLDVSRCHMLKECGICKGENVGIMFGNGGGARYPAFWLGTSYLGASVALIPPQLKSSALAHTLKAANISCLVFTHHLIDVIEEIKDTPELRNVRLLQYNIDVDVPMLENAQCVASKLKNMPATPLTEEMKSCSCSDPFLCIYTSGTTGLPKAAIITHFRYFLMSCVFRNIINISTKDVVYTPLPLHHTAGGILGVGQGIVFGIPVVLRNKFSVSNFWKDCIKYKCTVAQYIGEICRFLLNVAKKSGESDPAGPHCIRVMAGNGLRSSIWKTFQETFKIPNICEIYGSTEGNTNLVNNISKTGAVGYIPRFLSFISPIKIIKCDNLTGEPIRGDDGFYIECEPCEAGLLIGRINPKSTSLHSFTGYVDRDSTKKKILRNVFKSDDTYFNSGDILVMDDFGFYYFKDRTGDTFRWRGENVSTTEVENAIIKLVGLDTVVYGVQLPNVEGRAGMAVIVDTEGKLDISDLAKNLIKVLPPFAHPMFIRIASKVSMTTTFKMIKRDLLREGFDIKLIKDKIYYLDNFSSSYIPLTEQLYDYIINGKIRL